MNGSALFLISTYGNGGSPMDGEDFMDWIKNFRENNVLEKLEFAILGLGNRSFDRFCGNSVGFREALLANGAK
jgi:sulfite reductase alpha subunit-like flavoprotein